jgi:hypothetical protein
VSYIHILYLVLLVLTALLLLVVDTILISSSNLIQQYSVVSNDAGCAV